MQTDRFTTPSPGTETIYGAELGADIHVDFVGSGKPDPDFFSLIIGRNEVMYHLRLMDNACLMRIVGGAPHYSSKYNIALCASLDVPTILIKDLIEGEKDIVLSTLKKGSCEHCILNKLCTLDLVQDCV